MTEELTDLVARQQGVISRRQALRSMSAGAVQRRIKSGRWQTPHRGIYVTHSGPVDRRQRRWIAALAAGSGQVALLGGLSALETLGLRGFTVDNVHVLVPSNRTIRNPPPDVVVHRTSLIDPHDVHRSGSPPGTRSARSLIDAAQWATSDDRARAIIAAGFQQRLVRADDINSVLGRTLRARRRAVIVEAVRDAAAGAHSLPEAEFLRLCRRARLPVPDLQHRRKDRDGKQCYLDAYFSEWGVHVEIDGGQHVDVRHWWADMRRQNELWIPGDRVLRFPAWAIRHRPQDVTAQVRAALSASGWTPRGRKSLVRASRAGLGKDRRGGVVTPGG